MKMAQPTIKRLARYTWLLLSLLMGSFLATPIFAQTATVVAPFQITLVIQNNQADLSWTDEQGDTHAQYTLYRSTDNKRANAVQMDIEIIGVGTGNSNAIDYKVIDNSLQPGVTYTYWLVQETKDHQQIQFGPFVVTSHAVYLPLLIK